MKMLMCNRPLKILSGVNSKDPPSNKSFMGNGLARMDSKNKVVEKPVDSQVSHQENIIFDPLIPQPDQIQSEEFD